MAPLACDVDLRPKGADLCGLALRLFLAQSGEAVLKAFVPRLNFRSGRHLNGILRQSYAYFNGLWQPLQYSADYGVAEASQQGRKTEEAGSGT
jgi:hypothetical protein